MVDWQVSSMEMKMDNAVKLNHYENVLIKIASMLTPEELRAQEDEIGLPYEEILEMAYENALLFARMALKGEL